MSNAEDVSGQDVVQQEPLLVKETGTTITVIPEKRFTSNQFDINNLNSSFKKRSPAHVDVQWHNISYSVSMGWHKEKKTILQNHSGKARYGEMTGIIGGPGSGKTTLLKILAGYTFRNVRGTVALNGKIQKRKVHRIHSRYIAEDEDVHPYLTVREVIQVSAKLKVRPRGDTDVSDAVSEVIRFLSLTECQNKKTKYLSKDQRKRLAIAQELVNNPPILFLDEPTSGLDSTAAVNLMQVLKNLSDRGHAIICTAKQPSASVVALLDKVYIISNGDCVYQDVVSALVPFLEHQGLRCPQYCNPLEYMLEVVTGLHGDHHVGCFKSIVKSKKVGNQNGMGQFQEEPQTVNLRASLLDDLDLGRFKKRHFAVGPWTQFHVILFRTYKSILRNPFLTHLRLVMHVGVALVLGLLYWKIGNDASRIINNTGFLFISLIFLMATSMMFTVFTFPGEMSIFVREQVNNWYSGVVYYVAKAFADVPFQVLFSVIYVSIVYWMTDQPPDLFRFGMFLLLANLTSLVAQSVGFVVGAATKIEVALLLAPVVSAPIIIFSDYFLQLETVPSYLQWIAYLSYFRFAFEGVLQVIYGFHRSELHCPEDEFCPLSDPAVYLEMVGLYQRNVWYDVLALVCFFFFIRAMGYGVLKWKIYFRK